MLEYLFLFLSARRLQSDYFCLKIDGSMLDTFSISSQMARAVAPEKPTNLQVPDTFRIDYEARKPGSKLSKEIP